MRVLFLTHNYPRHAGDVAGGFLHPLAVALRQRGVDLQVIAPSDRGQDGDSARGRFVYLWQEGHPGTVIEMAHMTPARRRIFDAIRVASQGWDGRDPVRRSWPT